MNFNWYKIFNKAEFEATGLPSKEYEVIFPDQGIKTILVTKGNFIAVKYDDVFLCIGLNARSPFIFENKAVYLDANNDVWVGDLINAD